MNLEVVRNNADARTLGFTLGGTTPAFANLLRKTIVDEVPTLAIEFVTFNKNSSVLYDEMLAHRIGLIPLKTDLESYQQKGDDELSALNSVKFTLQAKGPCTVYAKDIQSQDPKVVPVFDSTPIVKLLEGQEVDIEATAILGSGKEHAKWSPGLAHYSYQPTIKSGDAPAGSIVGSKVVKDDAIPHSYEPTQDAEFSQENFVFTLESFGQLEPKTILEKAISLNKEKLDAFVKLL